MDLTSSIRILVLLCSSIAVESTHAQQIHGVCFSGPPKEVGDSCIAKVQAVGAEWICLIPYAYGPDAEGRIIFDPDGRQWWGEGPAGIRSMIIMAKARGMKVMLKPHLWLGHGAFTGTYAPENGVGWEPFEGSYAAYVLYFARLAEELDVDLFCIGTELERFISERLNYWQILIDRVSDAYDGPLTYAANWDEVDRFPLWKRMTYIGVDGYFPLCTASNPTMDQLRSGWRTHVEMLGRLSERVDRPVLFTEIGYCCSATCAREPWREDRDAVRDEAAQALAYKAFFDVLSDHPWYAGSFIWKWFADGGAREERHGLGFSPQGKEALRELQRAYR